jgi:hypothetical protein
MSEREPVLTRSQPTGVRSILVARSASMLSFCESFVSVLVMISE